MESRFCVSIILSVLLIMPSVAVFAQIQGVTTINIGSSALALEIVGNSIYVTNPYDGTISVIDKNSNQITNTINTTKGVLNTQILTDKNKLYASAWGQSSVYVYNLQTNQQIQQIPLGILGIQGPMDANKKTNYTSFDTSGVGMAYDNKTQMLYAAVPELNQIQIIDTTKDQVIGKIPVGITPVLIKIDSVTNTAYVTNQESNNISVINLDSNQVIGSIATGYVPAEMEIDPDHNRLYVSHHVSPYVSIIDLTSNSLVTNVQLKGPTHALALDKKTGLLLVTYVPTSPFTGTSFLNRVDFIDTNTNKVINGFDIPSNPFVMKITDNEKLFASVISNGAVYEIDLSSDPSYQQIVSQSSAAQSGTTVPEFGPIAVLVLAIAIVSIIAVSSKTGLRIQNS